MNILRDLSEHIAERIKSPLLFSFCIAWLLHNWKVSIGLFWYNVEQMHVTFNMTHQQHILAHSSTKDYFWIPFGYALGYTLIFPFARHLIDIFRAQVDKGFTNWKLRILRTSKVPTELYLNQKKALDEQARFLETTIDSQLAVTKERDKLAIQLKDERKSYQSAEFRKNQLTSYLAGSIINGKWRVDNESRSRQDFYYIDSREIKHLEGRTPVRWHRIDYFAYNEGSSSMLFQSYLDSNSNESAFWELRFSSEFKKLSGTVRHFIANQYIGEDKIVMTKIEDDN